MRSFRAFFKTKVGKKPQSETAGEVKAAEDGYSQMASSMRGAFGGTPKPPEPDPPPADVSPDTGSLGGNITAGINRLMGK